MRRLFAGRPRSLISHLIREETLSEEDLRYLENEISTELKKRGKAG